MMSNGFLVQGFKLSIPLVSLWLVGCSGGDSSSRPTSFKEHVNVICETAWDTVKDNETIEVSAGATVPIEEIVPGLMTLMGAPPVTISTDRIKMNTSEKALCECTKDMLIKSKRAERMFLGAEAESVYKGLKKGTFEELSAKNQAIFNQMSSHIGMVMEKCVYDASLKGN